MIFAYTIFFSFIAVFLATAVATIGGLIGKLPVPDKYLKILVSALLVEVAAALVLQFKTLDITTLPQQLEKQIMAVEMPLKTPGSKLAATEKLTRLIEIYRNQSSAESELSGCKKELGETQKKVEAMSAYDASLTTVFHDPSAVVNLSTAVEEMFRNEAFKPLLDTALAKHNFYDFTQTDCVWKGLRTLPPDHVVSQSLTQLRKNRLGPFSAIGCNVLVSVPPVRIGKAEAVVRTGSQFESTWIHLSDTKSGGEVWVRGARLHDRDPVSDSSCKKCELIQVSADDAAELFRTHTFQGPVKLAQAIFQ